MPAENQTNPKLKDVKDIVEVCTDFASFETACRNELRNRNLLLTFITREPGKNTQVNSATFSIDQVLDEIEGLKTDLFTYFKNHKDIQPYPGEYQVQIKNGSSKTILTSAPRVIFKGTGTKTDPKTKPGTTAAPTATSSMTKDILTALPSIVSAVQLLQPKPQTNNDSKLILDFMKYQQENMDRLQDQRKEDRKEMKDLVENITASRSPVAELAELEEFRQTVTANTRPSTPPLIGGASPTASAWDRLADLGGRYLESAMNQHNQRQGAVQQEEIVDAKRAAISELAAEEQIDVSVYLEDLANLIKSEVEPIAVLKGVQETLTFAKEHNQLDQIKELSDNDNDLELALLSLCESATENADYVNAVMKSAQPFIPLVAAELGLIKVGENGKPDMEHANPIGVTVSSEEPQPQETT